MKRCRFNDEEIIAILKEQEGGMPAQAWTLAPTDDEPDFTFWTITFPEQGRLTISLGHLRHDVCLMPLLLRALLSSGT